MSGDETRAKILAAAGPVFADKGFQGATVRDICQAADVNGAAVNYYFGDKKALYVETMLAARKMRIEQVPLPTRPSGTPPKVLLHDFIHTMVQRMVGVQEAPWQMRLLMREMVEPSGACEKIIEDHFRPQFERLQQAINQLLPAPVPAYKVRQIGYSIIGQCLYYRVARPVVELLTPPDELAEHYAPPQLADHITQFTLAALGVADHESATMPDPVVDEQSPTR